jgi:hypothetical protein
MPPGHLMKEVNLQAGSYACTTELAPGHTKHLRFIPEILPHQVWEMTEIENTGKYYHLMFPYRQHTHGIQDQDTPLVTTNTSNFAAIDIQ